MENGLVNKYNYYEGSDNFTQESNSDRASRTR